MRGIKKRFLYLFLLLSLTVSSTSITAYANGMTGGASGEEQTGNTEAKGGNFPWGGDYGFRIFLYDTEDNGVLWEGDEGYYRLLKNVADTLDSAASESGLYLGVDSKFKAYDESFSNPWQPIKTITDEEFNTMPGIDGYSSPSSAESTDFSHYAELFNNINKTAETGNGMQDILDWFSAHGVSTESYNPDTTVLVIEPFTKWTFEGEHHLLTYQNIRRYNGQRNTGCFDFFSNSTDLEESCTWDSTNKTFTPYGGGSQRQARVNGYLGGFYQDWIFEDDDCGTIAYSPASGYAFYGASKIGKDSTIAANVSFVYTGVEGFFDKDALNIYYSVNRNYPDRIYNPEVHNWVETETDIERINIESADVLNNYTMAMQGIYSFKVLNPVGTDVLTTRLNIKDIELHWNSADTSNGDINVGKTYKINGVSFSEGDTGVRDNLSPAALSLSYKIYAPYQTLSSSNEIVPNQDNVKEVNRLLDTAHALSTAGIQKEFDIMRMENLGVSMELLYKMTPIKSHMFTIAVDTKGSFSTKTETVSYFTASEESFFTSEKACYAVIIPMTDSRATISAERIRGFCQGSSKEEIIGNFVDYFSSSMIEYQGELIGGEEIAVGSAISWGLNCGYVVYVLEIDEPEVTPTPTPTPTPAPVTDTDADFIVYDYELNHVYGSVNEKLGNSVTIGKSLWTIDDSFYNPVHCYACGYKVGDDYYKKDFCVIINDKSSGTSVSKDNSLSKTKLFLYNTSLGAWANRSKIVSGFEIDTSDGVTYVPDYAFNLVRSLVNKDVRTVSTIRKQSIGKDYAVEVLGLDYDNKPKGVVRVSPLRSSFATLGTIQDTLLFDAKYKVTNTKDRYILDTDSHSCYDNNGTDTPYDDTWGYETWNDIKLEKNALSAFKVNGGSQPTYKAILNSLAYKYSTDKNEVGECDEETGVSSFIPAEENDKKPVLNKSYSLGVVKTHDDIELKFYPEVPMKAYEYSGASISSEKAVQEKVVYTMGEELRKAQSSSLYILNVKRGKSNADVPGKLFSDSLVTGNNALGADLPVIPGGGDVNLVSDCNFTMNFFGYSVDVINASKDSGGLNLRTSKVPYKDIIFDGSNVHSSWGNSDTTSKLFDEYEKWVEFMTDVDTYQIDIELRAGDKLVYNNFSTTFGSFTKYENKEEGVFPIEVREGRIIRSTKGYKALIESIAKDYDCEYDEAEKVFNESGLLTQIINAIESTESDYNGSTGNIKDLGTTEHWYDEEVRTIVIRRYCTTPVMLNGMSLSDKIDFNAAGTKFKDASWYFTLYFATDEDTLKGIELYNPSKPNTKKKSIESGGVLIHNLYIANADFYISDDTTMKKQ